MYGMVTLGLRDYTIERFGASVWTAAAKASGVEHADFVTTSSYPDSITTACLVAAVQASGVDAATFLEGFGAFWVLRTAEEKYPHVMRAAGGTVDQFFAALPRLHDHVRTLLPELAPPTFSVLKQGEGKFQVTYWSERDGLDPMVVGLLKGIAQRFGTTAQVTMVKLRSSTQDFSLFDVHLADAGKTLSS
ncbi:MAG: heme NO-binding domain-containing protein [Gemmatimonadota bacterium]|nr:heme NO-binding domain-containing protein [Gemmatimonadota bacterium]